ALTGVGLFFLGLMPMAAAGEITDSIGQGGAYVPFTWQQQQGGASATSKSTDTDALEQFENRRIVINIPSRTLTLFEGYDVLKRFPVGVGRSQFPTPTGQFKVLRKVKNPGWENPYKPVGAQKIGAGANNPLGTRWIGFHRDAKGEYGMHGTDTPSSVGQYSSHGCVRMQIKDAETLFDMVEVGTPVAVTYDLIDLRKNGEQVVGTSYADAYGRGRPTAESVKTRMTERFPDAIVDEAVLKQAVTKFSPSHQAVLARITAPKTTQSAESTDSAALTSPKVLEQTPKTPVSVFKPTDNWFDALFNTLPAPQQRMME
ncbi:MAG: L,D-transpeptidase, partial [Cyanobacteria bacterium HKST-UBA05]|nr:L,D-transpeptidase [Cyanobacteria bacterium HKST-UBA05]